MSSGIRRFSSQAISSFAFAAYGYGSLEGMPVLKVLPSPEALTALGAP